MKAGKFQEERSSVSMANNESKDKGKSKLDVGGLLKGLFKRQKPAEAVAPSQDDSTVEQVETSNEETIRKESIPGTSRPRPETTASITMTPEERVLQHIAIVGPATGALHNMHHILLRRGYDADFIPLESTKRGAFERYSLGKPLPANCECIILFEPTSIDQTKNIIGEINKKGDYPLVLITRMVSNPLWDTEILKQFNLSDRFLVRFSFPSLHKIFQRIVASPRSEKNIESSQVKPAPGLASQRKPALVEVTESEKMSKQPPQTVLVEVEPEYPMSDIEEKTEIISSQTSRPMAALASLANDLMVHYRIKGREDEGLASDKILTRREFERLFHTRFQEKWRITRIQDPKAIPPIIIELVRVTADMEEELEVSPEPISVSQPLKTHQTPPPPAPVQASVPPQKVQRKIMVDLSEKTREVRKWWQSGRTNRIYGEMENIRRAFQSISKMDQREFIESFVPLINGAILFAKGRLDRTIESTLYEFFTEDLSRNGLHACLRTLALMAAGRDESHAEAFQQSEEAVSRILAGLLPNSDKRQSDTLTAQQVLDYLSQLDELVENTLSSGQITSPIIYEYFEKLQKITSGLHEALVNVDPDLLILGRLDQVILRSQTRSDWAFTQTEQSTEWKDRLQKYLHYLAQIRVETFRVRRELAILMKIAQEGIPTVVAELAAEPYREIFTGEALERLDEEHLREPRNKTVWHIDRHRANYLIDLLYENDPAVRAYATFDEENIVYTWMGRYQATQEQIAKLTLHPHIPWEESPSEPEVE